MNLEQERSQAHTLLDLLPPAQLGAVRSLLEVMIGNENVEEELTDEDYDALFASREYFRKGGKGISFEQMVSDLGFIMDQVLGEESKR